MVINAGGSTGVIRATSSLTIGIVLSADIVRDRLRIFRGIGGQAAGADAAVGKGGGITGVGICGS